MNLNDANAVAERVAERQVESSASGGAPLEAAGNLVVAAIDGTGVVVDLAGGLAEASGDLAGGLLEVIGGIIAGILS